MTVKQLIIELKEFPEEMEVVFKPCNSDYVESFDYCMGEEEIRAFYGNDRSAIVLHSGEQVGLV